MSYFVLIVTEGGDVYFEKKSKEEILEDLNNDEIGEVAQMITENNLMEAGAKTYIIKGELVAPQEKKVVKEYDIE